MTRAKLGLALAGGGFRASLFHLGVLRRMAELDLLRHVQVLSTVSGGSIIGALYVLLLKERLEDPAHTSISRAGYLEIVDELQHDLIGGIRKNLRTRLFMNPFTLLKVLLFKGSLAAEMGRLYEKHVFGAAIARLQKSGARTVAGRIPLTALRLREAAVERQGSAVKYNLDALGDGDRPGSAVTSLILNATSLNSGARFWFSPTEIGDWYLGHVRHDEIRSELLPRKVLLDLAPDQRDALLEAWPVGAERWKDVAGGVLQRWGIVWESDAAGGVRKWGSYPAHAAQLRFARWYLGVRSERVSQSRLARWLGVPRDGTAAAGLPLPWSGPIAAGEFQAFVRTLLHAEDGRLRNAKIHAWYLAHGRVRTPRVDGGMDDATRWMFFWDALKSIDQERAQRLEDAFGRERQIGAEPPWSRQLFDWVLEVYYCATAAAMSPTIEAEWDALPLADAVAASAAFPPVFPPYQLREIYDDTHVQVLSLTDGGPFDNLGVTALLDERCNYVIASDTGAPFDNRQGKAAVGRLGMMRRLSEMLMYRPAQLYRHDLYERRRMGRAADADGAPPSALAQFVGSRELRGLAAFRIGSPRLVDAAQPAVDPRLIASLRTDLDVFGDVEIKCLVNEGYVMADQYLRVGLKGSPFEHAGWAPARRVPLPLALELSRVERILKVGRHRFFRALMLWAPLSSVVTLGAAAGLVAAVWIKGWEWPDVYAALVESITWAATQLLSFAWLVECVQRIELKWVAAIALLVLVCWLAFRETYTRMVWPVTQYKLLRDRAGIWRKVVTLWKNLKRFKGNLLWLFKYLPLAVFVVSALAWVSHAFFAKPFQWKTRDPEGIDR
jgi:predicted acylesterase/phospholipase RssA